MIQSTPVTSIERTGALRARRRCGPVKIVRTPRWTTCRTPRREPASPPAGAPPRRRRRAASGARLRAAARRGRRSRSSAALVVGARRRGSAPRHGAARSPTRGRAATTPRCTRCSRPRTQRRVPLRPLRRRVPRRGEGSRRSRALTAGRAGEPAADGAVARAGHLRTRVFGTLTGTLALPVVEQRRRRGDRLAAPTSSSPGCGRASSSPRAPTLPPRAAIQARDGTPLAEGEARLLGSRRARRRRSPGASARRRPSAPPSSSGRGVPAGAPVGLTGLEREFDAELAGTPGGELRAGDRVLASVRRSGAAPCARRSTPRSSAPPSRRSPAASAAIAVHAPARRRGARARRDRLLGAAAAGLDVQDHHARRRARGRASPSRRASTRSRPAAMLEGVELENANGESCGGTLQHRVRALVQLGLRADGRRARAPSGSSPTAERFGFNEDPGLAGRDALDDPGGGARSATTSPSARPRSARARCSPPRWRWPASPPRSPRTGCACARRCARARRRSARGPRRSRSRARSAATCAPS